MSRALALGLLAAAGCADGGSAATETAREALTVAPPVSAFVVLARHGASFDDRSSVVGSNIGVLAGTGVPANTVTVGSDTHVAQGNDILTPRIVLRDRANVGNLDVTTVVPGSGGTTGTRSPFVAPPAPPTPTAANPGTTVVTVASGQTTTIAAGRFAAVTVTGTLNLSGGQYDFRSLRLDPDARLFAQAPSVVRIATGAQIGDRARVQAVAPLHAGDLRIETSGVVDAQNDGVLGGTDVQLTALVIASAGIRAADRLIAHAALAGQDVTLGHDTQLTFDTGFGCTSNADCNDGDACTSDVCADAQCQHPRAPACAAVAVSCGGDHACAVMADGRGFCWGADGPGALGSGTFTSPGLPTRIANLTGASGIAAGLTHSCALMADGTAQCWGDAGSLGDGSVSPRPAPGPVPGVTGGTAIAAGGNRTCVRRNDGTVMCWGGFDENGNATPTPFVVAGLAGATAVSVGNGYQCAVSGGQVLCWGQGNFGVLGDGGDGTKQPVPTPIVGGPIDAVSVSAADGTHACAVRANGGVVCWGQNQAGEIGDGSAPSGQIVLPTAVVGLSNAIAVAAGKLQHTCAARSGAGNAVCWGANFDGQLGFGTPGSVGVPSVPVQVSAPSTNVQNLTGVTAIAAAENFTCAIASGSALFCWGSDGDAQLGNGTDDAPPSAVPIAVQISP